MWSWKNSEYLHCLWNWKKYWEKQLSNAVKLFFGAVKLTKHVGIDLYKYVGYGIGFDRKGVFSIGDEVDRNVIIFGADMS